MIFIFLLLEYIFHFQVNFCVWNFQSVNKVILYSLKKQLPGKVLRNSYSEYINVIFENICKGAVLNVANHRRVTLLKIRLFLETFERICSSFKHLEIKNKYF